MILSDEVMKLAAEIGMGEQECYDLGRQFFSVYPDNWETLLMERLEATRGMTAERRKIEDLRTVIQAKENQLRERSPAKTIKILERRVAELDKILDSEADEPGPDTEKGLNTPDWRREKSAAMGAGG